MSGGGRIWTGACPTPASQFLTSSLGKRHAFESSVSISSLRWMATSLSKGGVLCSWVSHTAQCIQKASNKVWMAEGLNKMLWLREKKLSTVSTSLPVRLWAAKHSNPVVSVSILLCLLTCRQRTWKETNSDEVRKGFFLALRRGGERNGWGFCHPLQVHAVFTPELFPCLIYHATWKIIFFFFLFETAEESSCFKTHLCP